MGWKDDHYPTSATYPWAYELNGGRAVECKTCCCVYTEPYPFFGYDKKLKKCVERMVGGVPKTCTVCRRNRAEAKRKALPPDAALIAAVREHAERHYDEGGWD